MNSTSNQYLCLMELKLICLSRLFDTLVPLQRSTQRGRQEHELSFKSNLSLQVESFLLQDLQQSVFRLGTRCS
jgi:hypothetical protein